MMFRRNEEKTDVSPNDSDGKDGQYYPQNYPGATTGYADDVPYSESAHAVQPPVGTTERKLMTKIDLHVVPFICVLYLLAFLDRVNIANANIFGLSDSVERGGLGLRNGIAANASSSKYNTALTIFFVPYVLFEIPSNILLKKFTPRVWLSSCMFLFGLVTVLQGLVQNYSGLLATRFFLGLFEASAFPGCFYLLSSWYRRHEAQKRYSFFFSSTTLAGAFGGLLAAAIGKMEGIRGYRAWRWVFILEGAVTVLFAIFFFFTLPNFPEESNWLTAEEKQYVTARLRLDQGNSARDRPITLRDIGRVFKDYKVITAGFMYFGLIVPAYGYAYFAPGIIKTYGYGDIETQLRSVPPWAAAFGFSMLIATVSDAFRHRWFFTILPICISIVGFGILIAVHNNVDLQYAALFLVTSGTYSAMPVIVCWFNMNLGGHHRRAVGSAWQVGFGNIGGIISTWAFRTEDAPKFISGYSICIAFTVLSIIACNIYGLACWGANKNRAKSPVDVGLTEHEKTELGDMNPEYRYML